MSVLHLRHEVKAGYKGCCRCSKRFLPYYVGSDGHWYCEDCGQELVKKKKTATFGVWGDPYFKFNFNHRRCAPNQYLEPVIDMSNVLEAQAREFGEANRVEGGSGWALMASFAEQVATERVADERRRLADDLATITNGGRDGSGALVNFIKTLRGD